MTKDAQQADKASSEKPSLLWEICDGENLPSLPAAALRVLQLSQAENVSVIQLAQVIGQDPALTAKILRFVNSPLFGVSRKIVSLPQAMVVLGLRTVKVLTLSFSIVDGYGRKRVEWFDYTMYWRRSLTHAVAGRLIAEAVAPIIRDEALIAGLLSNLGMLAMAQAVSDRYQGPCRQAGSNHAALLQAELASLGFTHQDVGKALFEQWNLPPDVCLAVALHHTGRQSELDERVNRLVDTVYVAGRIADAFCDGATQANIDELHELARRQLGLDGARLDRILESLNHHVKESALLMSVDIGQTVSYEQLREQAIVQLAKLSVSGEADLAAAQRREAANRHRQQELEKAATTDSLSGLANRAAFDRHLEQVVRQAAADHKPVGLILCDLDRFKRVNDTYGHAVGDQVIAATGAILAGYNTDGLFAARHGGEEFAVIVPNCPHRRLVELAQEVCAKLCQGSVASSKGTVRFYASAGGASTEALTEPSAAALFALADKFLYLAKKRGRARACVAASAKTACPAANG